MYVFTSLQAAVNAGFRYYLFSREHNLHIVEMDRMSQRTGLREKALAFARTTDEDAKYLAA